MAPLTSRRNFLLLSGKAGLGVYAAVAVPSLLSSCSVAKNVPHKFDPGFQQQPLPYSYSALNDAIDATTMEIHYTKHAAAYATNLQDAARNEGVDMKQSLEEILQKVSKYTAKLRNNGGGHYNHEMFWKSMTPNSSGRPSGKLATAIDSSFNSFESFKSTFASAGTDRFGSGWAWLFVDNDKNLRIGSTANQDNPLMDNAGIKGYPILGLDVWEHAYYLRYQNKRADYISNWWRVVNWDYVQQRYEAAV